MRPSRSILRLGAFGAAFSTLLLLAMAFVSLPAGMFYPGLEALPGVAPGILGRWNFYEGRGR